jgi:hypothetical protein
MPSSFFKKAVLSIGVAAALSGCSHKESTAPAHPVTAPAASTVSVKTPKPVSAEQRRLNEQTEAQMFVTAFGQGQLKLMQIQSGPGGLIAALVAPSGTKKVTPETPAAILWILPGGKYALQGNLIDQSGKNLTDGYLEKFGMTPVLIGEPTAPPVAVTGSALSSVNAPASAPTASALSSKTEEAKGASAASQKPKHGNPRVGSLR